jgi:hypothetical protein
VLLLLLVDPPEVEVDPPLVVEDTTTVPLLPPLLPPKNPPKKPPPLPPNPPLLPPKKPLLPPPPPLNSTSGALKTAGMKVAWPRSPMRTQTLPGVIVVVVRVVLTVRATARLDDMRLLADALSLPAQCALPPWLLAAKLAPYVVRP